MRGHDTDTLRAAASLRARGLTYDDIGSTLGVSQQCAWRLCNEKEGEVRVPVERCKDPNIFIVRDLLQQHGRLTFTALCALIYGVSNYRMRNRLEGTLIAMEHAGIRVAQSDDNELSLCHLQVDVEWTILGGYDYRRGRSRLSRFAMRRRAA